METMKAIEQRAIEYAKGRWDELTAKEAYIAGATDQKAIEEAVTLTKSDAKTEKQLDREECFATWYFQNVKGIPTFSDAIEWARRQTIDEVCEYAKARYDLDYCGNVRDVLNYLKSLVEE